MDAHEDTRERHWQPLVVDRPFVLGRVERMPFRTGAFDFLIASHVLEHSCQPEQALSEFQRVAKAGYIEVPDAFMERINPYKDHRLEATVRDGVLVIRKKPAWVVDHDLVELYEFRAKPVMTHELMRRRPFHFMIRLFWRNHIDFRVVNPLENTTWAPPPDDALTPIRRPGRTLRSGLVSVVRRVMSQGRRNRTIDIYSLLCCVRCQDQSSLKRTTDELFCSGCGSRYPIHNGIPNMSGPEMAI